MSFRAPRPLASELVVFSPLPPARNGIADYCAELMPAIALDRHVWIVVDDHAPQPEAPAGCRVLRLSDYVRDEDRFAQVPHIYQLGNNVDHVYLLPWLAQRPGVVVLHDVSLHHLIDQATLRWDDRDTYEALLRLEYGELGCRLAAAFRRTHRRPQSMFYELPMIREIVTRSCAVIVHSLYAAIKVQAQGTGVPVVHVNHHVTPAALKARLYISREEARRALDLDDDTVLLLSLGFVTKAKQIDTVLRYLARHRNSGPKLRYVIAGQEQPDQFDVRSLISSLALDDIADITGYIDETSFYYYIRAADIVVNLRYPSGGETSGTLIRALGAGACVVVNDIGPFSEFPDDVCAKVPIRRGRHDADFESVLSALIASPALRRWYGERATSYAEKLHCVARSAAQYLAVIDKHSRERVRSDVQRKVSVSLPAYETEALLAALPADERHLVPAWCTRVPLPMARPIQEKIASALCVGLDSKETSWLTRLFGYSAESIEHVQEPVDWAQRWRLSVRRHTMALVCLSENDTWTNLPLALARINSSVALHGTIVIVANTLPGDVGVKLAVSQLIAASGFAVNVAAARREGVSFALDEIAEAGFGSSEEPAMIWLATKVSDFVSPSASKGWGVGM